MEKQSDQAKICMTNFSHALFTLGVGLIVHSIDSTSTMDSKKKKKF
jgi:hypothetical protein